MQDIGHDHLDTIPEDAPPASLLFFYLNSFLTLIFGNMFNYGMVILSRSLTGSDGFTGLVFMGLYGPTLVFGLYAGILLDRYDRKIFLYATQFIFLVNGLVFMSLLAFDLVTAQRPWLIMLVSIVHGSSLAFLIPARFAFLGNLVRTHHIGRVTIVLNILVMVAFGSAPVFTGLLKATYSYVIVFGVIAAGFLFAWLFLPFIQTINISIPLNTIKPKEGFKFILKEKLVLELLLIALVGFFIVGPVQVLFPEFARTTLQLDEVGRGSFMAMLGVGLFLGGIFARYLNRLPLRGWLILICTLFAGLSIAAIAGTTTTFGAAGMLVIAGVFGGILSTLVPAAIQTRTPDKFRGRVMSVYSLIFLAIPALSGFAMGILADMQSMLFAIFTTGAIVSVAALLCTAVLTQLRRFS